MIRFLTTSAVSALKDRKGVTAAEYAVMAAAIVIAVGLGVASFSTELQNKFAAIIP